MWRQSAGRPDHTGFTRRCIGGRGAQESWIRRQGGNAGHENGWLCCGPRGAHFMRWRWEHRGAGIAVTLSKPTAHADGVPADSHEVGYAPGDSQSDAEGTESRTLIEPAIRGADTHPRTDTPSRTDSDAIGGEESLAVTDPRGDHHDPDRHCSPESVDCHPVGDDQPVAEVQARRRPRPRRASLPRQAEFPGSGGRWPVCCLPPRSRRPFSCGHTVDKSGGLILRRPSRRWRGLPACSSLSWVSRALLTQVEGGWTVGANRIAAVEDRLTVLEASAPDDATRTETRTLRDAVRASRGRVEELLQSGDPEAISPTLNEVAAGLEAALGSVDQAG